MADTVSVALVTAPLRSLVAVMGVPVPPSAIVPKEEAVPARMSSALDEMAACAVPALSASVAALEEIPAFFRRSSDIATSMATAASWRPRLVGTVQVAAS